MRWDASRVSTSHLTLSANDATATHAKSSWTVCLGDEFLSADVDEVEIATECVDNLSLFVGVASPAYWAEVTAAAEEGEEKLPRNSKNCICMHGDGRCFIKAQEKDWGLMKLVSGGALHMLLDFERGVVQFRLSHTLRGKLKETIAEIPGLPASATLVLCCGGRDQQLTITRCEARKARRGGAANGSEEAEVEGRASGRRRVRDVFAEAIGTERIEPVAFSAPQQSMSYEQQIIDMAKTLETSN